MCWAGVVDSAITFLLYLISWVSRSVPLCWSTATHRPLSYSAVGFFVLARCLSFTMRSNAFRQMYSLRRNERERASMCLCSDGGIQVLRVDCRFPLFRRLNQRQRNTIKTTRKKMCVHQKWHRHSKFASLAFHFVGSICRGESERHKRRHDYTHTHIAEIISAY